MLDLQLAVAAIGPRSVLLEKKQGGMPACLPHRHVDENGFIVQILESRHEQLHLFIPARRPGFLDEFLQGQDVFHALHVDPPALAGCA